MQVEIHGELVFCRGRIAIIDDNGVQGNVWPASTGKNSINDDKRCTHGKRYWLSRTWQSNFEEAVRCWIAVGIQRQGAGDVGTVGLPHIPCESAGATARTPGNIATGANVRSRKRVTRCRRAPSLGIEQRSDIPILARSRGAGRD